MQWTSAVDSHRHLSNMWCAAGALVVLVLSQGVSVASECTPGAGHGLKYLWGDAMNDPLNCIGPSGNPYPSAAIARSWGRGNSGSWSAGLWAQGVSARTGRASAAPTTLDPRVTQQALLRQYEITNKQAEMEHSARTARSGYSQRDACPTTAPTRLCKTRYNTTAPMYGVSLTSGQPVTIVQKFPDLLQQVVFEVCESSECDVVRGECTQTYVPYLFLVIPLGPVTLTGQDYVLVESGCVCRPKSSASAAPEPSAPPPPGP
ncbi:uncharacterized protein LOC113217715 isoform X1 [Frankliniella occidentalis]|uniref:Uncharacterized protein LOC113217715 isoform X1 n=2 Tax=Frankliniella occidentalis TaxID=133901 RepID=A0A6J1TPJ8_FRAOC|nr:uncharacterized protein LOC113217715 isoform X1 [Frankliniella occidentalis]